MIMTPADPPVLGVPEFLRYIATLPDSLDSLDSLRSGFSDSLDSRIPRFYGFLDSQIPGLFVEAKEPHRQGRPRSRFGKIPL